MSNFKIGLWGTAHAGKTTCLAMLYQAFLASPSRWNVYADDESRRLVQSAYEQIFENQTFPEKTIQSTTYRYTITAQQDIPLSETRQLDRGTTFTLVFEDAAGELFEAYYDSTRREDRLTIEQRSTNRKQTDKSPLDLFEHLSDCEALIILIDPARTAVQAAHHEQTDSSSFVPRHNHEIYQHTYRQLLFQLFEDFRKYHDENRDKMPAVAFCLTKIDANDHLWAARYQGDGLWHPSNHPDKNPEVAVIQQHLGRLFYQKQLPGLIPMERVRGFLVSAIGRQENDTPNISTGHTWQRPRTPRPPAFQTPAITAELPGSMDRASIVSTYQPRSIFNPQAIAPYNLIEPILWLVGTLQAQNSSTDSPDR